MARSQPEASEIARDVNNEFGIHVVSENSFTTMGETQEITMWVGDDNDSLTIIEFVTDNGFEVSSVNESQSTENTKIVAVRD